MTGLTDLDRCMIARARALVATRDMDALRERTGETDDTLALASALGEAKYMLAELAAVAEREDQAAEDTRRLDVIRGVLGRFDWERDDRQLALEAIERIAEGGQA